MHSYHIFGRAGRVPLTSHRAGDLWSSAEPGGKAGSLSQGTPAAGSTPDGRPFDSMTLFFRPGFDTLSGLS